VFEGILMTSQSNDNDGHDKKVMTRACFVAVTFQIMTPPNIYSTNHMLMPKAGASSCKLSLMVKAATGFTSCPRLSQAVTAVSGWQAVTAVTVVTNWKSHKRKVTATKQTLVITFLSWPSLSLL
jgi:hypothetical protein